MSRSTNILLFVFSLILVLASCKDKDEYYEKPEWVAAPIYQQLEAKGNFKTFLTCIDKAGYKNILGKAGYWTIFAPNDEAFSKFLTENNYGSINDLDSITIKSIVEFALIYNAYDINKLCDYQSPTGWITNKAFRRKTAFYTGVYTDTWNDGQRKFISSNRHDGFIEENNNNKHITYFIDRYMNSQGLSAYDYNYFYPNSPYKGLNVLDASIVNFDIKAENGLIHEIDKVLLPLANIEEYLKSKPEYSEFKRLLEKYGTEIEVSNSVTKRNQILTGSSDPVYIKYYNFQLNFSPNNEEAYLKYSNNNDGQANSFSVFIPNNDVLNNYIDKVLLKHYKSFDELPPEVKYDFFNAHLWPTTVWPSKFDASPNINGEFPIFNAGSDISEAKVLSNGMFYGTKKVQDANVFRSVYGRVYLNPDYGLLALMLRGYKQSLIDVDQRYTLFMLSDETWRKMGYNYRSITNEWTLNDVASADVNASLARYLALHIVYTPKDELKTLSGTGLAETYGGEIIKYQNGKILGSGNHTSGTSNYISIDSAENAFNGTVHYISSPIKYVDSGNEDFVSDTIKYHAVTNPAKPFKKFWEYLEKSSIYVVLGTGTGQTRDIAGINQGTLYTIFIPSDAAISDAVANGLLPSNPASTLPSDKEKVTKFLNYHIIKGKCLIPTGRNEGGQPTLLKLPSGEYSTVYVGDNGTTLEVFDQHGRKATVNNNVNAISGRVVIHQIDNYLQY